LHFNYWVCVDFADKKWGKGKDRIDDEDITFQRMVAKVSALIHPPLYYVCVWILMQYVIWCSFASML